MYKKTYERYLRKSVKFLTAFIIVAGFAFMIMSGLKTSSKRNTAHIQDIQAKTEKEVISEVEDFKKNNDLYQLSKNAITDESVSDLNTSGPNDTKQTEWNLPQISATVIGSYFDTSILTTDNIRNINYPERFNFNDFDVADSVKAVFQKGNTFEEVPKNTSLTLVSEYTSEASVMQMNAADLTKEGKVSLQYIVLLKQLDQTSASTKTVERNVKIDIEYKAKHVTITGLEVK